MRSVGGHHGASSPVSDLGLGLYVNGDSIRAWDVYDLLNGDVLVLDDINVLNYLLGDVDVFDDLDLYRGVHVLDDINVLVDDFSLVDGVGAINIDDLDSGHVSNLFDLDNLGHVLDDFIGGINILGNMDVFDHFASLSHDFRNVSDNFEFTGLSNYLGHVSDDFLDLWDLNVLDGYGNMHSDGCLDMLDLRDRYGDLADLGYSLDDGYLDLLFNDLLHRNWSVDNNLAGDVTNLRNLNLNRAGDLSVLNDLNRDILVDDLMLRDLNYALYRDRACDLLFNLHIFYDGLYLHLGHFNDSLIELLNILDLGNLNDTLLCRDLGNMNNALLSNNLGLNHLYGGMLEYGSMH